MFPTLKSFLALLFSPFSRDFWIKDDPSERTLGLEAARRREANEPPPDWAPPIYCKICGDEIDSAELCADCANAHPESTIAHTFENDDAFEDAVKYRTRRFE